MDAYNLSNKDIAIACNQIEEFISTLDMEPRDALRAKLTIEEVLLEYQTRFGDSARFSLRCAKRFWEPRIEIFVPGQGFNPLEETEGDRFLINSLLAGVGMAPSWNYKNGVNSVVFIPRKRDISQTTKIVAAILLSFVVGFLLTLLPENIQSGASELFLTPLTNLFMGLISAISGPLVFLSVLNSICSMGNMETLGKFGQKTVSAILAYVSVFGLILSAVAAMFFNVSFGGVAGLDFSQILELIYDIFPSNFFEPFVSGNILQIIFISVLFGIAMLILSSRVSSVFTLVEQLSYIVQTAMNIISQLLPFSVFVIFANMFVSGNMKDLLGSYRMILIMLLQYVLYFALLIIWTAVRKKISVPLLVKKLFPTYMIALTTASSAASFSTSVENLKNKFGIEKRLVDFGVPLGHVLFKPYVFMMFGTMELAFAESHGIDITISWLIIAYITNLFISFALPPVQGGPLMCCAVAFTQLGIPMDAVGVAIAILTIMDFPGTSMSVAGLQMILVDVADSMNMLDKETLRKKIS